MTINWQNGLVNTGLGAMEAFNAGRKRSIDDQAVQRADAARTAEGDYFAARRVGGISTPTIDRGTEMGLPMGGNGMPGAAGSANQIAPATPGASAFNQNEALIRLAQADPSRAFALEDREKAARSKELDDMHKLNAASGRLLAGVSDQASYESAMGRMKKMFARYGENMDDHDVPATYDPAFVQSMRMSGLEIDKQLAAERGVRRLEWDIEDDEADNARADRNADSVISDRSARRDITMRGQNLSDARGRRGQDLADTRARRGQDMTSADRQRGQNGSNRRPRDNGNGRRERAAGGRAGPPMTATDPKTGQKMQLVDNQWVPLQ